jgi:DivIVA domain-containing protein
MTTPEEIELKAFPVTMRGFDQDEVAAFLTRVADEFRTLLAAVDGRPSASEPGSRTASPADEGSDPFDRLGSTVEIILRRARQEAEQSTARSTEEARQVSAEARDDAWRLRSEAQEEARRLVAEAQEEARRLVAEAREEARRLRGAAGAIHHDAQVRENQAAAALDEADRYRETARLTLRDAQRQMARRA